MENEVKRIPEGYHTVTPTLTVKGAVKAIEFYQKAFGAVERFRMMTPDGKGVAHAELMIGDSIVMLSDEIPGQDCGKSPQGLGGTPVGFYLYVRDADAAFKRAVEAGATSRVEVQDMFWGDRMGQVADPFGHVWSFASHVEDLSPEEIARRGKEFFEKMGK